MRSRFLFVFLLVFACQSSSDNTKTPSEKESQAAVLERGPKTDKKEMQEKLSWFEDDFEAALSEARKTKKPLIADLWAPWCHTCLSMKSYILTKDNLQELTERYVFLAINTEKKENDKFLQKYPVEVWPTFYVIDPLDEEVQGRWLGAASSDQFRKFLQDGQKAIELANADKLSPEDPLALLIQGDQAAMEKRYEEAATYYEKAIKSASSDWPRHPDALVSFASALRRQKAYERCTQLGLDSLKNTGNTASATDFTYLTLSCADQLPKDNTTAQELYRTAEQRIASLADDSNSQLTADDRSDAYRLLWNIRETIGDKEGAKEAAEKRLVVLREGAKGYPDEVALLYDWATADTFLYLERPEDAIDVLQKRAAALPDNYNPPHYLARVYQQLERYDEALKMIDQAIPLAYGPRKAGLVGVKASILASQNKLPEAQLVLEEQLRLYQELPDGQKQPKREEAIKERLAKMKTL